MMKQIFCPICKTDNPVEANFCRHCGHQFKEFSIGGLEKRISDLKKQNAKLNDERDKYLQWWYKENKSKRFFVFLSIALILTLTVGVILSVRRDNRNEIIKQAVISNKVIEPKRSKVSDYDMGEFIFSGTLKDGLPNGFGEATYKDGRKFTGTFVDGKRHGKKCVFTFSNGDVFEGEFSEDNIFNGVFTSHQKESFNYTFTGEFHNNAPYSGTWRDNNGAVFQTLLDGSVAE